MYEIINDDFQWCHFNLRIIFWIICNWRCTSIISFKTLEFDICPRIKLPLLLIPWFLITRNGNHSFKNKIQLACRQHCLRIEWDKKDKQQQTTGAERSKFFLLKSCRSWPKSGKPPFYDGSRGKRSEIPVHRTLSGPVCYQRTRMQLKLFNQKG